MTDAKAAGLTTVIIAAAVMMLFSVMGKAKAEDAKPAIPGVSLAGCYVQASGIVRTKQEVGTGNYVEQIGAGFGCDAVKGNFIVGAGARLDMGQGSRQAEVFGKLGVALNATGTSTYGLLAYQFDASGGANLTNLNKGGVVLAGAGVEQMVSKDIALFIEGTKDLAQVGTARGLNPLYVVRTGLMFKF